MSRSVFYGFGSYVGSYSGSTTCSWWPVDPSTLSPPYDASKLITNDLAKNPQAYRNGTITLANVQIDDAPTNGGLTKIGPTFPGGTMTSGAYLEQGFYTALAAGVKPNRIPPGMQCRDYELSTVQYYGGVMSNRRFFGFYVEIQSVSGATALTKIWNAGTSLIPGHAAAGTWWFNLSNQAMPIEKGFTAVGTGVSDPRNGALFLDAASAAGVSLTEPKLPASLGSDFIPRS